MLNKNWSLRSLFLVPVGVIFSYYCFSYYYYLLNITISTSSLPHNITVPAPFPYIALIIDGRANIQVVNAVNNVLQHIPTDWKVQFFTDFQHRSFYENSSLAPFLANGRVFMTPIDFPRGNLSGGDFINLCLTSISLWNRVKGDKVLYFQYDSVICSNSSYKLTDFLHYDFIGAPWSVGGCCNGGFSIRSRTKTLQLLANNRFRFILHKINEDGWYSNNLYYFKGVVAPISVAKTFSVETIYHPRPFSVHNPYLSNIGRSNMDRLCAECPEMRTISPHCQ